MVEEENKGGQPMRRRCSDCPEGKRQVQPTGKRL